MNEEQRDSVGGVATLVDIVNVESAEAINVDVARKHGELVDGLLRSPPVVATSPALYEPLDVSEGHTVVPACILELVWEAYKIELPSEEVEIGVGNRKRERLFFDRL